MVRLILDRSQHELQPDPAAPPPEYAACTNTDMIAKILRGGNPLNKFWGKKNAAGQSDGVFYPTQVGCKGPM